MAAEALLQRVPTPTANVHPMHADPDTIQKDAERYEQILKNNLPLSENGFPVQMVQAHGELEWYLDETAARYILNG
jgi:6-phosphogluconolactonase/glucosamine-6-phosphate isomerase/deaminase